MDLLNATPLLDLAYEINSSENTKDVEIMAKNAIAQEEDITPRYITPITTTHIDETNAISHAAFMLSNTIKDTVSGSVYDLTDNVLSSSLAYHILKEMADEADAKIETVLGNSTGAVEDIVIQDQKDAYEAISIFDDNNSSAEQIQIDALTSVSCSLEQPEVISTNNDPVISFTTVMFEMPIAIV